MLSSSTFQGFESARRASNVHYLGPPLYIDEWKDTGFQSCDDAKLVRDMYFSTMACVALYCVVAVISLCVGFGGSICVEPVSMDIQLRYMKGTSLHGPVISLHHPQCLV